MSIEVSAAVLSAPIRKAEQMNHRSTDYHSSIWGDHFLSYDSNSLENDDDNIKQEHQKLKNELNMLFADVDKPLEKFKLIDAIQRLGVSYHFEEEIELVLQQMYLSHKNCDIGFSDEDLYTISLKFRLFRQNGYNIPWDTFNKFKDDNGNFKSGLNSDVRGLLELYEASYLRVHGEDILDEAISFTTTHLALAAPTLDYPLLEQVDHALKQSIRRGLPRVEARRYISIYKDEEFHNKALLEFAKIDFNLLQLLHRQELSKICRWWKNLDFKIKLPYARDRVVECYFWAMGVYFEPQYSLGRWFFTKVMAMTSILDDTYDSYGTYDELILYTDAIERWDIKCMDQLPDYMKISYKALLDVYEEMEQLLEPRKRPRVEYAKKEMIRLAQAYLLEAKWTHENYKPAFEEYKANALSTSTYAVLATTAFVGMGDVVTQETFNWAANDPNIIRASTIIARFMDDVAEHKFNHRREDDFSAIECYMEQCGVSAQEAYDELNKHIENSWKDINKELLKPTEMPTQVLNRILNLACMMDFLFKDGDGYTYVGKTTKSGITSLLIDPVPL